MPISPGLICTDDNDDESHWQDRVSSGFDRLVAFASTELTKSRRSIEDGAPSTSPDSGINQSSDGRTFLSSSSSSSQLDAPTHSMPSVLPIMKTSPAEVLDSPPPSEMPRTPSPSSSPPLIFSRQSPALLNSNHSASFMNDNNSSLQIPLKYQRQSKSSSQKHYKKKFRERTWGYDDYEDDFAGTIVNNHITNELPPSSAVDASDVQFNNNHHSHHHHKSSKFRPKGKDWGWRSEHHRNLNHENDTAHA